jgi:hypothetical protein
MTNLYFFFLFYLLETQNQNKCKQALWRFEGTILWVKCIMGECGRGAVYGVCIDNELRPSPAPPQLTTLSLQSEIRKLYSSLLCGMLTLKGVTRLELFENENRHQECNTTACLLKQSHLSLIPDRLTFPNNNRI